MNQQLPIELSIVMPCLNEVDTVGICIEKAQAFIRENQVNGEIIVADNGSNDGSRQLAKKLGARVVTVELKGYGYALQEGIIAAQGKYVIMGDSDDSYDFYHLMGFLEKLRLGYELVMGNRFQGGISKAAMPTLHRVLGNPMISFIGRTFFRSTIGDFFCGLRGFRKDVYDNWNIRSGGMTFAIEMVVKATASENKVIEIPTTLTPDGRGRKPHLKTWRDGWRTLKFLLLYSPEWLFFYPGLLLVALGTILILLLFTGPKFFGGLELDLHTVAYSTAFVSIGINAVSLSIISRLFIFQSGLLPNPPLWLRRLQNLKMEWLLLVGIGIFFIGLCGAFGSLYLWKLEEFNRLDNPQLTLRIVMLSCLGMVLGIQTIMSAFLLSVINTLRK